MRSLLAMSFLAAALLSTPPAISADAAKNPVVAYTRSFNEGDPRNNVLMGEYWLANGVWHLDITVGIWGASDFFEAGQKEVERVEQWQTADGSPFIAKWAMFEKARASGRKGFDAFPEIKAHIETQLRETEKMMNTPFLKTRISFFFIDESKLAHIHPRERGDALGEASTRATLHPKPFLPLRFGPLPLRSAVPPGDLDPYTYSEFTAHELFHHLSRNHGNDGYAFIDYPLNGIMNGGEEFRRLRLMGHKPQLQLVEWNTFLLNQARVRERDIDSLDPRFVPNYHSIDPMDASNMMSDTVKTRVFGAGEFQLPAGSKGLSPSEIYRLEMDEKVRLYTESLAKKPARAREKSR